ncbi:MAG: hypothetical protein ACJ76J_19410 [Thermoanaerobaculia bacterium]
MAHQDHSQPHRPADAAGPRRADALKELAQTTLEELNRLLQEAQATGSVGAPSEVESLRFLPVSDAHVDAHSDYHSDVHGDFHADTHGDRALVIAEEQES